MKISTTIKGLALGAALAVSTVAEAVSLNMQRVGSGPVSPSSTVRVDVFVDDVIAPQALRGYQVTAQITPQAGATGSLTLAPDTLAGVYECLGGTNDGGPCTVPNSGTNCPGGTCSGPSFVDDGRADWVYSALASGSALTASIPGQPTFAATLLNPGQSVVMTTPRYVGTVILQASANALGNFTIGFNPSTDFTFLIDQSSFDTLIPYTPQPITVSVAVAPGNDNCSEATTSFDGITSFTTQNATTDGPSHPGSGCDTGDGGSLANDIWFNYTATCTGILTVSTCGNTTFDTRLGVYNGCACPVTTGNLLACNENGSGCTGGTSKVVLSTVTQGTCLKLRVGGAGGQTGTGELTIACVPNDTCATARALSVPSSTNGATIGASVDSGLPVCNGIAVNSPGVWYSVTGTDGVLTASLCSAASYDTRLTVFQGGCAAPTCIGGANNTCGNRESISWCSTVGTPYLILVHGSSAEGTFTLAMSTASCNDNNACTDDACATGVCSNTPNFIVGTECCNPGNGTKIAINDNNPCTNDSCNSSTGQVTRAPVPNGLNAACDDTLGCTVDECFNGNCRNTNVEDLNLPCTDDDQCPGDSVCGGNVCVCGSALELVAGPGSPPEDGCYAVGDQLTIRVELAFVSANTPIVGAQFFLQYDASSLDFLSIEPGVSIDPKSPFALEFNEQVNEIAGTIDYLVSLNLGQPGTTNPATVAVMTFDVVAECAPFVIFRSSGPNGIPNRLSATGGVEVIPGDLADLPQLRAVDTPPVLSGCPATMTVGPDAGLFTAAVSWPAPTATDNCDGVLPVTCSPPSGTAFPAGTTSVTCTATNSCGLVGSCSFDVTVDPPIVTTSVQLSPTMATGPFTRCITFDAWDCDAPGGPQRHSTVQQNLVFVNGLSTAVQVPIPGGGWDCLTARDRLHTLRSTAADFTTTNGIDYTATFVGNRATGGHWLVSGNLNDDAFIDILDFGVFVGEFLSPAVPNTPCGTVGPDGNINGDNVVDLIDFVFVQVNSLKASEPACCGGTVVASGEAPDEGPVSAISIRELQRRGLYHLIMADLNRDGILDEADVAAFMNGVRPSPEYLPPKSMPERPKALREVPR